MKFRHPPSRDAQTMWENNRVAVEFCEDAVRDESRLSFHRFVPVPGYANPNMVQAMFLGAAMVCRRAELAGREAAPPDIASAAVGLACAKLGWPVYAVKEELAESLMRTDPPEDMKWEDLEWPIQAATFLLPKTPEVSEYFLSPGHPVAITIGNIWSPIRVPFGTIEFMGEGPRILSVTLYHDPIEGFPMHLTAIAKPDERICDLGSWQSEKNVTETTMPMNDADFQRQARVSAMAGSIIAFMASGYEPAIVSVAGCPSPLVRPASEKHKRAALYGVRWIGEAYRRKGPPKGGHHASPIVHWRRGFFRSQPFGPGRKQRKPRWIEPTMVNPKKAEEKDAA